MRGRGLLDLGFDNTLIALSLLLWGMGSGAYFYVWPIYVADLGAGPSEVGLLLGLGGLSSIAGYLVGGVVESRFNWRSVLLSAWIVGTVAALAYGLAQTWWALLPGVFLLNFSGFGDPSLSGYIASASDRRRVGTTFTTVFAGFSLGMAVSPALGGWLSAQVGIRPLFFASFALYGLSTLALLPIAPRHHHVPGPDEPRLLVGEGVSYRAPLRVGAFRRLVALLLALLTTTYLGTALLPLFLQEQAGLPTPLVGGLGSLASLGGVAISLWLGRWSDRLGIHRALALSSVLLAACFGTTLLAPPSARLGPAALYALSGLAYVLRGSMTAQSSLARASVLQVLRPPVAGRGFAIQMIAIGLAQTIGPFVAGLLYAGDPRWPLGVATVSAVVAAVVVASRPLAGAAEHALEGANVSTVS